MVCRENVLNFLRMMLDYMTRDEVHISVIKYMKDMEKIESTAAMLGSDHTFQIQDDLERKPL